jgi:L-alanine-DL-glutamate epimerase-like enolase superfamily enzyme
LSVETKISPPGRARLASAAITQPADASRIFLLKRSGEGLVIEPVPIASGENACTHVEFARTIPKITYTQPSVIKVGGVSEFMGVCYLATTAGKTLMPHAPYFGPGYWATLQLMSAQTHCELFEFLYIEPEAWLDPSIPVPKGGVVRVPEKPGLGFEPDEGVIAKYRV